MMDNLLTSSRFRYLFRICRLLTAFFFTVIRLQAASGDSLRVDRPGQITFIYPIGTNGLDAYTYSNHFSLNILTGISGGTKGFEAGGLVNIDRGSVSGLQVSGLTNLVSGSFQGVQLSGLVNLNESATRGAQLAGLVNVDLGEVTGLQGAGLVNVTGKGSRGASFAGLSNIQAGHYKGLQGSGLVNVTTREHHGAQLAGLVNVSAGSMNGLQAGGIANITPEGMKGAQVAGIINYTGILHGSQIGFINYSDSISKGVPVGFISIVKHGYRRMEWEANETFLANLTFKTGTTNLYNIFSVGYHYQNDRYLWGVTYGLGTLFHCGPHLVMNMDLTSTQVNENEPWTHQLNLLNKFKMSFGFMPGKRMELFAGISLIAHVYDLKKEGSRSYGWIPLTDMTFYEDTINGTRLRLYPGIHGGIRF